MDPEKVLQGLKTASDILKAKQIDDPQVAKASMGLTAFFSRRFSSPESIGHSLVGMMHLHRLDFPLMKDRVIHEFCSGNNRLKGYLYDRDSKKGTVLCVHGLSGQADDYYSIGINEWLVRGYDVFAIDLTASGASEGHGIDGLHQSSLDVAAAVKYVRSLPRFKDAPLFLFGHSWGAYGVAASTHFRRDVDAISALSGFDTPLKEMLALPSAKLGFTIDVDPSILERALQIRAGEYYNLSASRSLLESGVPALIIHGDADETVPLGGASLFDNVADVPSAKTLLLKKGHMDIFLRPESCDYAKEVRAMANDAFGRYKMDINKATEEEKRAFLSRFDRRLTSLPDPQLFDAADEFFQRNR